MALLSAAQERPSELANEVSTTASTVLSAAVSAAAVGLLSASQKRASELSDKVTGTTMATATMRLLPSRNRIQRKALERKVRPSRTFSTRRKTYPKASPAFARRPVYTPRPLSAFLVPLARGLVRIRSRRRRATVRVSAHGGCAGGQVPLRYTGADLDVCAAGVSLHGFYHVIWLAQAMRWTYNSIFASWVTC